MKSITLTDIRLWGPCYDLTKHLPEDWQGTALDLLKLEHIPAQDRLWLALREELIDAKTLRLFAVWCARQVEHLLTDVRSRTALDVAERFAHGEATQEELKKAELAAWDAARIAKTAAGAAWDPYAAWALEAAARSAAYAAKTLTGGTDVAAKTAANAAWVAYNTAIAAQVAKLIEMLESQECPSVTYPGGS